MTDKKENWITILSSKEGNKIKETHSLWDLETLLKYSKERSTKEKKNDCLDHDRNIRKDT